MSGDVMNFPNNWWTFVQQYQFADKDEVYTNGSMLIPSFRVRQMVEHYFGGEVGKTSRHAELFGTPERAARTMANVCRFTHGGELCDRCQCYLFDSCDRTLRLGSEQKIYDALLEWLRGDAE